MKYWNLKKANNSTLEKLGPIPRSITKTFEKLKKELDPTAETEALEEYRVTRYLTVNSIKFLLFLILAPVLVNQLSKILLFGPCVDYYWNHYKPEMFLNLSQEERAFAELQQFEERIHFEILIGKINNISYDFAEEQIKIKAVQLAQKYAYESSNSIKNVLSDTFSTAIFVAIVVKGKKQLTILKSFINEILYGLSDTAKAFLIILFTDVFVGFHSPHGWEVILESALRHFGLPENRDFIFLFISTFPVILDTIFKYWIFRYLNRVSPSAVATYRNMNE